MEKEKKIDDKIEKYNMQKDTFDSYLNNGQRDVFVVNFITDAVVGTGIVLSIYLDNFNAMRSSLIVLATMGVNTLNCSLYLNNKNKMQKELDRTLKDIENNNDQDLEFDNDGHIRNKAKQLKR